MSVPNVNVNSSSNTNIKSVGFYNVMATYTSAPNYPNPMETYRSTQQNTDLNNSTSETQDSSGSNSPRGHVSFTKPNREDEKDKRQKYLTARYGQHQMMLIRKRLAVEDWVYEQLRCLYDCKDDSEDHDCNLDLDDVLNYDTESERRDYAEKELVDAKQSPEVVQKFIDELIQKAKTL